MEWLIAAVVSSGDAGDDTSESEFSLQQAHVRAKICFSLSDENSK